jgi:hypothetical protein
VGPESLAGIASSYGLISRIIGGYKRYEKKIDLLCRRFDDSWPLYESSAVPRV